MRTTRFRNAVVLIIGVLAATLLPSAAQAQDAVLRDARDDRWVKYVEEPGQPVRRYEYRPDFDFGPAPDIVRTKYRHLPRKVRVVVKLRHLQFGYVELITRYRTNEGLRRRAELFVQLSTPKHLTFRWTGRHECAMSGKVSRRDDRVLLDVPRRCLGDPRRVRVVSTVEWWPVSDETNPVFDVSARSGHRMNNWSMALRRG